MIHKRDDQKGCYLHSSDGKVSMRFEKWSVNEVHHAVNVHDMLVSRLNGIIGVLESVRANIDKPEKFLGGSWYSFDSMLSDEINRLRQAIIKEREVL